MQRALKNKKVMNKDNLKKLMSLMLRDVSLLDVLVQKEQNLIRKLNVVKSHFLEETTLMLKLQVVLHPSEQIQVYFRVNTIMRFN